MTHSTYGKKPVPWSVLWTGERDQQSTVAPCPFTGGHVAVHTPSAPGTGKPIFGKTHEVRQRQAVAESLCDICGCSLARKKRIALGNPRTVEVNGREFLTVVEPFSCTRCALLSIRQCPHLAKMKVTGELVIREVIRHSMLGQLLNQVAADELNCPEALGAIGHLKIVLLEWKERSELWLRMQG